MKIFERKKENYGKRTILVCGVKILDFISKSFIKGCFDFFKIDVLKFKNFSNIKNATSIILGSSHAMNGFHPNLEDYNLGCSSQDLYTSYKLYEYVLSYNAPLLKNVVLFYSPFSSGFQLCRTSEAWKCIPYKIFYGIDYQEKPTKTLNKIEKIFSPMLKKYTVNISKDYRGESCFYQDSNGYIDLTFIARRWLKHNTRNSSQHIYIENFINKTNINNHNFFIILPPIRADLRLLLPSKKILFKDLYKLLKKYPQIQIFDFYESDVFDILDFKDCDHLNERGAKKLSSLVHNIIDRNGSNPVAAERENIN